MAYRRREDLQKYERRSSLQIYSGILKLAKRGIVKTQIMYRQSLSFDQLNEYVFSLMKNDLLNAEKKGKSIIFVTSDEGKEFLEESKSTLDMLNRLDNSKKEFTNDSRSNNEKLNFLINNPESIAAPALKKGVSQR